jgi:hypothetical protein
MMAKKDNAMCTTWAPLEFKVPAAKDVKLIRRSYMTDTKDYDLGKVFVAHVGQAADNAVLGYLFCSYKVELNESDDAPPYGQFGCRGTAGLSHDHLFGTDNAFTSDSAEDVVAYSDQLIQIHSPGLWYFTAVIIGTGLTAPLTFQAFPEMTYDIIEYVADGTDVHAAVSGWIRSELPYVNVIPHIGAATTVTGTVWKFFRVGDVLSVLDLP